MIQRDVSELTYKQLIEKHIGDVNQVRSFPQTANNLMDACKQSNVNIKEIIQLIECDPTIASKLLSLSNSPLYGTSRPVSTVGHAVVILGFQTVSQVAVSIASSQVFAGGDQVNEAYRKRIFSESIGVATVSRVLSRVHKTTNPDEAFLAGIVQEIGQLIFLDVLKEQYFDAVKGVDSFQLAMEEDSAFGISHTTVGELCGSGWGLPSVINSAIANHHSEFGNVQDDLSRMTICANHFARKWNLGFCDEAEIENEAVSELFASNDMECLESECRETFVAVNEIFAF